MAAWIEPLTLEQWILHVLAGSPDIFLSIALFFIFGMAAYFRMSMLTMMFMLVIFVLMFEEFLGGYLFFLMAVIGGLMVGYWVKNIISK